MSSSEDGRQSFPSSPLFISAQPVQSSFDGSSELSNPPISDESEDQSCLIEDSAITASRKRQAASGSYKAFASTHTSDSGQSTTGNLYHRHPSTWRSRTAAERDIAGSLDQLRAKDLSIHLFNVYKLKRREHDTNLQAKASCPEDETASKRPLWMPPKHWTAWPMRPSIVPRESEEVLWKESNNF
ncbi:MAG: hypothetical protein Q9190_005012, partial [Brigantiaea leucoxantha]